MAVTTLPPRSRRTMRVVGLGEHALLHIASGTALLVTVLVLIWLGGTTLNHSAARLRVALY